MSEVSNNKTTLSTSSRRRVLITGVSGLLGRLLYDHLTRTHPTKYEVFGLDRHLDISPRYQLEKYEDAPLQTSWPPPRDRFLQCDITDRTELHRIILEQQIEILIHLAALLESDPDIEKISRVNIDGTKNVFEAPGVRRIIFASSMMTVFGYLEIEPYRSIQMGTFDDATMLANLHKLNVDADPPLPDLSSPGNEAYSRSKIIGEQMAAVYVNGNKKSIICVRFGGIHTRDEPPEIIWRQSVWCSHRDACSFVEKALEAPLEISGTYFAVSNNYRLWVDMENAKRDLGFEPQDGSKKP